LADVWTKEIELHSATKDCIKMLVGNKVDKVVLSLIKFFHINIDSFLYLIPPQKQKYLTVLLMTLLIRSNNLLCQK
jgi:hypothetical protein